MLKRTRISRRMDVGRLGASLARPGIDTRLWVSLAYARGESEVDSKFGVFVDVTLVPTGENYTAKVPADYAGNGFGFYAKIHKDDALVVAVPSGDPAHGCVVMSRLWNSSDVPPQDAKDNVDDVVLVVEQDKNLRVTVTGQGKAIINAPVVEVGDIAANDGVLKVLDGSKSVIIAQNWQQFFENTLKTWLTTHTHPTGMGPSGPPSEAGTFPAYPSNANSTKVTIPDG